LPDRHAQIILLISSRFDFDYQPETFTGKVVRRAASQGKGASPSHWQPCPSCDGGHRRNRFGKLEPCDQCGATGRVRVDDYTGEQVVTAESRDISLGELIQRDTKTVRCPDCQDLAGNPTGQIHGQRCRRCTGTGHAPVAGSWLSEPADPDRAGNRDPVDAMLAAIDRKNHAGSYRQLEQAMAGVIHHVNKPLRYAEVTRHAVEALRLLDELYLPPTVRDLADLTAREADLVQLTIEYLDTQMPDPILVPRDVIRNAKEHATRTVHPKGAALTKLQRERRDRDIRKHARDGRAYQWIGQQYGLSDRQVREIINGSKGVAA
jgi:hypothetical protein